MGDLRALPSEMYAFKHLGLQEKNKIKSEKELMNECFGMVPEAIFKHPLNNKNISVEVKRIVGNKLPFEGGGRRLIRRRKHIIWPWKSTIEASLDKINGDIVNKYSVSEHHVVIVVPENLSERSHNRLLNHIQDSANNYFVNTSLSLKKNRIFIHVIKGNVNLFDRL